MQEAVFGLCAAGHQAVVDQQVNHGVGRNHVDVLLHAFGIVPVAHDVRAAVVDVHPTVPHHLCGIESFLLDAHGVNHARHAVTELRASVGVGVREDDLHAACAHASALAGTLLVVVVPATDVLDGKFVRIVVVGVGRSLAVPGACTLLVEGVGIVVPVLAIAFVAAIFHGPHRVLAALVDVEHLAAIFCLVDVEHLAAAGGASAMGVKAVADLLQFHHVLAADAFVAAFVEEYRGVVAVVNDGIAHQFAALLPLSSLAVLLGIARRHGLDEAHAVARFDILLPGGDVHPAHQVAARTHHQVVRVVAQPGRYAHAHAGPFVRSALGIAVHHQHAVVEPDLAFGKTCLAEARACLHRVEGLAACDEAGPDVVEVSVAPRPEVHAAESARSTYHGRVACSDHLRLALVLAYRFAVDVEHLHLKGYALRLVRGIDHLRLGIHRHLAALDVVVRAVDVGARRAEARIEGQRLIDVACDVQPDVLRQASEVGVEVRVVPLETRARGTFLVTPVVVGAHLQDVLARVINIWCQVEAEGHDAVLVQTQAMSVDPHFRGLACAFQFQQDVLARIRCRQRERLPVPDFGIGMLPDLDHEGIVFVPRVGQGDRLCLGLRIRVGVGERDAPFRIEVVALALRSGCRQCA